MTETELYHAGVKGMKWGVRNDKKTSGGHNASQGGRNKSADDTVTTTIKRRKNSTTITSRSGKQKAKLSVKKNRGAKLVAKSNDVKMKVIVANTANVAAGAMRVAAAFVPGLSVLNGVATAASLVGTVSSLKK